MQCFHVTAEFLEFALDPGNVTQAFGDLLKWLRFRGGQNLAENFANAFERY